MLRGEFFFFLNMSIRKGGAGNILKSRQQSGLHSCGRCLLELSTLLSSQKLERVSRCLLSRIAVY